MIMMKKRLWISVVHLKKHWFSIPRESLWNCAMRYVRLFSFASVGCTYVSKGSHLSSHWMCYSQRFFRRLTSWTYYRLVIWYHFGCASCLFGLASHTEWSFRACRRLRCYWPHLPWCFYRSNFARKNSQRLSIIRSVNLQASKKASKECKKMLWRYNSHNGGRLSTTVVDALTATHDPVKKRRGTIFFSTRLSAVRFHERYYCCSRTADSRARKKKIVPRLFF